MDRIIAFYLDSNKIGKEIGFTFSDVIMFNDEELEKCHGYIQWLFPNKDPSAFIPNAPVVTDTTMEDFNEFYSLVEPRMEEAYHRIMKFYFKNGRGNVWATPYNHNLLRITRIIKALKIFGFEYAEKVLWDFHLVPLMNDPDYSQAISPVVTKFWQDAHNGI